jgi:hypothetical protein
MNIRSLPEAGKITGQTQGIEGINIGFNEKESDYSLLVIPLR